MDNRRLKRINPPVGFVGRSLLIVIWLSFFSSTAAQKTITGRIVSEGKPVPVAHVFYEPEYRSTVTDENGYFSLPIPSSGNTRIVVFHPGFVGKSINLKDYKGSEPIRLTRLVYRSASKEIAEKITKEYLIEIFENADVLYAQHEWNIEFEYSGIGYKGEEHAGSLTGNGICQLPPLFREKFGKSQDVEIYFKSNKSGGFTLQANEEWVSDDYRKSQGDLNFLYSSFYKSTLQGKDKGFFSRVSIRTDSIASLYGETLVAVSYFIDRENASAFSIPEGRFLINLSRGKLLLVEDAELAGMNSVARFAFKGRYMSLIETRLTYRDGYCIPYYSRYIGPGEGRLLVIQAGNKEIPQYIDHRMAISEFQKEEFSLIQKLGYKFIQPWTSLFLLK
jgi:hypothetical protein